MIVWTSSYFKRIVFVRIMTDFLACGLNQFWCELPTQARRELLRIDKQTLCEQARKNLYCSRCHGLLLECYSQIVMYGKSSQQEFVGGCFPRKPTVEVLADNESDNLQDPSMHPWGGLATTKDGVLTLLDCFICSSSPDVIHKVCCYNFLFHIAFLNYTIHKKMIFRVKDMQF